MGFTFSFGLAREARKSSMMLNLLDHCHGGCFLPLFQSLHLNGEFNARDTLVSIRIQLLNRRKWHYPSCTKNSKAIAVGVSLYGRHLPQCL